MTVTSIRYQPIEGGALGGHFALHVALGAGDGPGAFLSDTDVAERIHNAFESLDLKFKAVRGVLFDCRRHDAVSEEMISLLGTLRDWGFSIVLWVGQTTRHPWFEYATYITVFVTSALWPNFKVNEIRYVMPDNVQEWTEPEVYDVNASGSLYLMPPAGNTSALLAFATQCAKPWGVILPAVKTPAIAFKIDMEKK
jgi:hypothetical protein